MSKTKPKPKTVRTGRPNLYPPTRFHHSTPHAKTLAAMTWSGKSDAEFAALTGFAPGAISRWRNGRVRMGPESIAKISKFI